MEKKFADFDELGRKSQGLIKHIDMHGMPVIQRNISQLDALSRRLARGQHEPSEALAQAQMFLANTGMDVAKYTRILRDIDLTKTYEPLEPISELELEKFLDHQHSMLMGTAIEESAKLTANAFRSHYTRKMDEDWEAAKRELLEPIRASTHVQPSGDRFSEDPKASALSRVAPATSAGPMGAKGGAYARIVEELNETRQQGRPYQLASLFKNTAIRVQQLQSKNLPSEVEDCWRLVQFIVGEETGTRAQPIPEKHYQVPYSNNSRELRQKLIRGAKRYSEFLFRDYILETIASNPTAAQHDTGGEPSLKSQVRGFLKVKLPQGGRPEWPAELTELDQSRFPLWPQIFYCFRCGNLRTALEVAESDSSRMSPAFTACLQHLVNNPEDLEDKGLPDQLWQDLIREYNNNVVTESRDPYKIAMYNLIGRCEPNPAIRAEYIYPTTEDYLWFKLSMLWESANPLPDWLLKTARFKPEATRGNREYLVQGRSLSKLQEDLRALGPAHFNADGRTPLLWFTVLLMSQQFEQAIHFLVTTPYVVEAVHFAICLEYYGLLRCIPDKVEHLLFSGESDGGPIFHLNFSRVIIKYVGMAAFPATRPVTAFHYFHLLNESPRKTGGRASRAVVFRDEEMKLDDSSRHDGKNVQALEAIKSLILETHDFDQLIGTFRNASVEKTGCVYRFLPDVARDIIRSAAADSSSNGNYIDAIQLSLLAEDFKTTALLVMDRLSRLATAPSSHKERQMIIELADQVVKPSFNLDRHLCDMLILLLRICQFFDEAKQGVNSFANALTWLESLKLLPTSGDTAELDEKVTRFRALEQSYYNFRRNIADLALATMEIYVIIYNGIKQELIRNRNIGSVSDPTRQDMLNQYRAKAKALVNFVGIIQLPDVNAKLVVLESRMS